jgi:predicted nucleic acid-binding protein
LIVMDASVGAALVMNSQPLAGRATARLTEIEILVVPEHFELEVMSAIRGLERAGHIDRERAREAFETTRQMKVVRWPHADIRERMFELRHNFTIHDAAYVALAEALDVPLLTADARLAGTAHPQVELL